jgi:hypothetical protein
VKCRKDFGIADDVEFLLEPHLPKSMLLILCSEESKLQAVAASLQGQLNDIAAKLKTRVREVAVSGTSMRAVIGSGGECRELLLKPSQSISVRFSATNITHRLSSPITTLTQVPKGFFSDLVTSCLCTDSANISDDEVWKSVPNKYCGMAATKRSQAVDLQSMSVGQIVSAHPLLFLFPILPFSYLSLPPPFPLQQVSAIEYTAGPICYTVNPFLRSCNEAAWLFPNITIGSFPFHVFFVSVPHY